jgi:hypothetical protein
MTPRAIIALENAVNARFSLKWFVPFDRISPELIATNFVASELLAIAGCGPSTIAEIRAWLRVSGLGLRDHR